MEKKIRKYVKNEIEVNNNYYKIVKLIDKTNRSDVYQVKREGKYFVYKTTKCCEDFAHNQTHNPKIIDSPNVVNIIEYHYSKDTNKLKIIMEYYPFPDLFYFVENENITEQKLKIYIKHIALRVKECHDKNIIHLDIKPENFVLRSQDPFDIVLLDFEFSIDLNKKMRPSFSAGTPGYCAPEMLFHKTYSKKTDIWAIGGCAYVLFTCQEPTIQEKRFNTQWGDKLKNMFWLKNKYSCEFVKFLNETMFQLPYRRPDIDDLLAHPWLNNNSVSELH